MLNKALKEIAMREADLADLAIAVITCTIAFRVHVVLSSLCHQWLHGHVCGHHQDEETDGEFGETFQLTRCAVTGVLHLPE